MDPRRHVQPPYEGRNVQASAVQRHGQLSVGYLHSRQIHPPELLENVLAQQAADVHELAGKNDYLARNNEYCRYDLVATQREINQLSEYMRINREKHGRTIKDLLDRIAKTERDIFDGESIKKELEESLIEKQMLLHDRHVLTSKIQQASQELGNAQIDLKRLPELRAELDSLREKLQREQKKSLEQGDLIIQDVAHMKIMEKNLEDMIKEIERLRAELLNAVRLPNELVQEFVASQQEIKKLREHIRNIRTEKDKEIANLLDRIGKMESGINENESIRRDLEEAHIEAQNLTAARDDLTSQIHKGSQELEKARSDIQMIPEMVAERDTLKTKHKKLWRIFKWKKISNIKKVQQMKMMEKYLVDMVEEVQKLQARQLNASCQQDGPSHVPPSTHDNMCHSDQNGRPCDMIVVKADVEGMPQSLASTDSDSSGSSMGIEYEPE